MRAITRTRLGRFADAVALACEVDARAADLQHPNLALDIRSTVAWITVLRREDDPTLPDPLPDLREIITAYAARDDNHNLSNRRLELALTLIQNSELDE